MLWLHSHQLLDTVSWWGGTRQYSCGSVDNFRALNQMPGGSKSSSVSSSHIALRIAKAQARPTPRTQLKYHMVAIPPSVVALAPLDIDEMHSAAHEAHHDARVDQHHRQEHEHGDQHDEERKRTARRIPNREARLRMCRRRKQEWKERDARSRD